MKRYKKILLYIVLAIAVIVRTICYYKYVKNYNYSGQVDYELVKVIKNPSDSLNRERIMRDSIRITFFIDNSEHLDFFVENMSLQQQKSEIKYSLNIEQYDYFISVGKRIIKCEYSKYFTDHYDCICECEDNRIPLNIKFSKHVTDSIYIYKLLATKNKFREPGP